MHELVKMKSVYEEKLDIELRVRRDLEMVSTVIFTYSN